MVSLYKFFGTSPIFSASSRPRARSLAGQVSHIIIPKPAQICARATRAPTGRCRVAPFPAIELHARGIGLYWFSNLWSDLCPHACIVGQSSLANTSEIYWFNKKDTDNVGPLFTYYSAIDAAVETTFWQCNLYLPYGVSPWLWRCMKWAAQHGMDVVAQNPNLITSF